MGDYYRLNDDHSVTEIEDAADWAQAFDDRKMRRVGRTELADRAWVSTVFLGLNHAFDEAGPPLIFETMVFQDGMDERLCWRYSTWEQAEAGHARAVGLVHEYLAAGKNLSDLHEDDQPA